MKHRTARVVRKTRETAVSAELDLDGNGTCSVSTGMPFFDHMLELLACHSGVDLKIKAEGDLAVDFHHTVEDVGLALGEALDKALATRRGIVRYGWSLVPMDEALSRAALDLGGRPFLVFAVACKKRRVLEFDLGLIEEFLRAFTVQARANLHVAQLYGKEAHHAYESIFKALAQALKGAVARKGPARRMPSSKGRI